MNSICRKKTFDIAEPDDKEEDKTYAKESKYFKVDVSIEDSVRCAVGEVVKWAGGIDILPGNNYIIYKILMFAINCFKRFRAVNNAAIFKFGEVTHVPIWLAYCTHKFRR